MLQPSDFNEPKQHPFGMLAGLVLKNSSQCESFLAWMLIECQKQGNWSAVQTKDSEPTLERVGLLKKEGNKLYSLTRKAKGLLYSEYGKDDPIEDLLNNPVQVAGFEPLSRDEAHERSEELG